MERYSLKITICLGNRDRFIYTDADIIPPLFDCIIDDHQFRMLHNNMSVTGADHVTIKLLIAVLHRILSVYYDIRIPPSDI